MEEQRSTEHPAPGPLFRGVLGGGCANPGRTNLQLIRRAIREGWDIPEDKRRALIEHLCGVVRSGHARNALAAIRCILAAERANLSGLTRR
jgi:hypothetical protein